MALNWKYKFIFPRNCAQGMGPQATGSNPLSGSIICPSSAGLFDILVFVLFSSVGVQRRDAFIRSNIDSLGQKKRGEKWIRFEPILARGGDTLLE